MLPQNGYSAYSNSRVMTASPAELTLMLYEGAIKFLNIAIVAYEKDDVAKASVNVNKVDRIIEEFQNTLDHKYPVAEDFDRVYTYARERLLLGQVKKDTEILNEVLDILRGMRDTWKDVMKKARSGSAAS